MVISFQSSSTFGKDNSRGILQCFSRRKKSGTPAQIHTFMHMQIMFNYVSWWQSPTLHIDQEAYNFNSSSKRKYRSVSVWKLLKQFPAFCAHRGSSCLGTTRFYWVFVNQGCCASRKNSIQSLLPPVLQKSNLSDFLITSSPWYEGLFNPSL